MIIAVTGTPGTGKDTISKVLAKRLGFKLVDLNKLARDKCLLKGYDQKRRCDIVDIRKLNEEVKKFRRDLVIQSHYAHDLNADLVVVLKTDLKELRKRLEKRGWPEEKIKENLEAEIFEICKDEALQKTKKVFEFDTTEKNPEKTAEDILNVVYRESFDIKNLKIGKDLAKYFKKPYGEVFGSVERFSQSKIRPISHGLMICVGDMASYTLTNAGVKPDIIIIDNKINRKPFKGKINFHGKTLKVINAPGIISRGLWNTIKQAIKTGNKIKVSVIGEEDLAVLPAVIMAPLGSVVFYGQPEVNRKSGLVAIIVDINKKKDAISLLKRITRLQ
ncbi:MAG: DUF359 domain-containing protein [Candidatus Aenigmarchaeota archaeon]|nr:DUF359 domain-containing protein [Candidatus Aenigmarchaeota archaeon]